MDSRADTEGVVLAAGRSSRTAPDCKLAFMMAGKTVLERSAGSMMPFCARVFVVTGAHEAAVASILGGWEGVTLVRNPNHAEGMYSSVKAGLRRTESGAVFVLPGDCPSVTAEVYEAMLATAGGIVLPVYKGRSGHPVLLRRPAILELLGDGTYGSLREFIAARCPARVVVGCPGILADIDTKGACRRALRLLPDGGA